MSPESAVVLTVMGSLILAGFAVLAIGWWNR